MKTVIILSVSSDIGLFLATHYLAQGDRVIGTYRNKGKVASLIDKPNCHLFKCDIHKRDDLNAFISDVKRLDVSWDVFISCVADPLPATSFFDADIDQWQASVETNSLDQLRVLHMLYPSRTKGMADVVFFAAGGVNNAVLDLSAYTIGKIMLTKMCEFIDAQAADLNIFIVGPGWTKTKVHQTILNDPKVSQQKRAETIKFLSEKEGTPLQDIVECIQWLRGQGKAVASGRNFSIAYDPWKKDKRELLVKELKQHPDMYKLRRHNNNFLQQSYFKSS